MRAPTQVALRVCALLAAALSSAAAADYYLRAHTFCADGSGCDTVRHSQLGQTIGQALPAIGMAGFASIVLLSLSARSSTRLLAHVAALTGAVVAAALLLLQAAVVGRFCALCVAVDVAALGAGAASLALLRDPGERHDIAIGSLGLRVVALTALMLALATPFAWALLSPPAAPAYVAALAQAGKVNVVEISDFQCPHCRRMHPYLRDAIEPYRERIHFVRKSFPLDGHRYARDASRAYVCALAQGRGEAMADALFATDKPDAQACVGLARQLGLALQPFTTCVDDPMTDARIDADMETIRQAGFRGLPTVWIGGRLILGFDAAAGKQPYTEAISRALDDIANQSASAESP